LKRLKVFFLAEISPFGGDISDKAIFADLGLVV
jgi:hypothetical protein